MASMDIKALPTEGSNGEEPSAIELMNRSKSIPTQDDQEAIIDTTVNVETVPTDEYVSFYFISVMLHICLFLEKRKSHAYRVQLKEPACLLHLLR